MREVSLYLGLFQVLIYKRPRKADYRLNRGFFCARVLSIDGPIPLNSKLSPAKEGHKDTRTQLGGRASCPFSPAFKRKDSSFISFAKKYLEIPELNRDKLF